jgi:hypothetical protein
MSYVLAPTPQRFFGFATLGENSSGAESSAFEDVYTQPT